MKRLIQSFTIAIFSFLMIACSSTPPEQYIKVGKVTSVQLQSTTKSASPLEILAGGVIGGVIGNQFGGGSGKYWATGTGAVLGSVAVNEAVSKTYNEIRYQFYFPADKSTKVITTRNLNAGVYKNDLVILYKKDGQIWFEAYGSYSSKKYKVYLEKVRVGEIHF